MAIKNISLLLRSCFLALFFAFMINITEAAVVYTTGAPVCKRFVPSHWYKGYWVEGRYVAYPCAGTKAAYAPGRYYNNGYHNGYYRHAVPTAHRHATYRRNHR